MSDIELDAPPTPKPRTRRARLVGALTAPAPAALVLVVAVLVVAAIRMPASAVPAVHEVRVGVSAYPATATAQWRDSAGAMHPLDPWSDAPVRVPAVVVIIAVAGDVDCTLTVDGTTVDTANGRGGVGVCSWVSAG